VLATGSGDAACSGTLRGLAQGRRLGTVDGTHIITIVSYGGVGDVVVTELEGPLTVEDIRAFLAEIPAEWTHRAARPALIDCRKASIVLSLDEVRAIAKEAQWLVTSFFSRRFAILATSDLAFGTARMFEAYFGFEAAEQQSTVKVRTFRGFDDALKWLGEGAR
jgi:hypothetical protein